MIEWTLIVINLPILGETMLAIDFFAFRALSDRSLDEEFTNLTLKLK